MRIQKLQFTLMKILIVLFLINYQVVTVGLHDFIAFKYLRDIVLFGVVVVSFINNNGRVNVNITKLLAACLALIIGCQISRTDLISTYVLFVRRYVEPIIILLLITDIKPVDEAQYRDFLRFILNLMFILGGWGIFQAFILGPSFLIKLGYPTAYSYEYGKETLKYSFFFGHLGVQRVVSTVSNSNVFAVTLGVTIIVLYMNHTCIFMSRMDWAKFIVILLAYLLTFSRANILAMIIVVVIVSWKHIPKKRYIIGSLFLAVVGFVVMYLVQNDEGITHKIVRWIVSSLSFSESSAAGRTGIWLEAFNAVLQHPWGIGFGKVGSWAQMAGVANFYHCENSYLAIALDLGWAGSVLYILLLIRQFGLGMHIKKNNSTIGICVMMIVSYMMICMFFSNHIYDMEAMIFCYTMIVIVSGHAQKNVDTV